ncbi:rhomboid family intramembrane serine protease [Paracoccus pantotrophus]|uniref:Rhomboid family intramembrane serine protease n=2 Tax=Paracoccaceae TaxID=31989 RepID=A0A7H9BT80_PARPN|nr:rhomboid family intramembrane serine protease [Paracoccus pantotrophus]RDD99618.1 rhomboid family intramembrane serine protease [Paracoccus pantotrophus]RNI17175.1 rhomboid family intramembrane serine protease [Paracoccus pantotrophus]WGR67707.1 rhomboid family intramembrane serine protease [Paracoccus pantotrophus]SFO33459.1 Membrane associated serine protease, rhomboid family [Paracoccus pantotrophus]
MRPGYDESPLNPVPAVVWMIALPMIACEAVFGLAQMGFIGGSGQGAGLAMRQIAVERTAYIPEFVLRLWQMKVLLLDQSWRILTYSFVHLSLTHALFVIVFTLALGNLIANQFRPWAVAALFFGSAVGGALVYTLAAGLLPQFRFQALIGGYPAVYGFVGAFTFLLWTRLGQENANRLRAFTLIGMLLAFQLVFGILFQDGSLTWIAEIAGFCCGFLLSFVLVPGGIGRVMRQIRQR